MAVKTPPKPVVYNCPHDVPRYLTERLLEKLSLSSFSYYLGVSSELMNYRLRTEIEMIDHNLNPDGEQFKDKPKLYEKMTELIYKATLGMDFADVRSDLHQVHFRTGILASLATVFNFWNSFGLTTYGWLPIMIAIIGLFLVYNQVECAGESTAFKRSLLNYQPYKSRSVADADFFAWACTIFFMITFVLVSSFQLQNSKAELAHVLLMVNESKAKDLLAQDANKVIFEAYTNQILKLTDRLASLQNTTDVQGLSVDALTHASHLSFMTKLFNGLHTRQVSFVKMVSKALHLRQFLWWLLNST